MIIIYLISFKERMNISSQLKYTSNLDDIYVLKIYTPSIPVNFFVGVIKKSKDIVNILLNI